MEKRVAFCNQRLRTSDSNKIYKLWRISICVLVVHKCSTTGKPTRSFATERVSLDSV